MKRIGQLLTVVVCVALGVYIGSHLNLNANGLVDPNMPGTANDPLVTKSYVDQAIRNAAGGAPGTGTAQSGMNVIQLTPGQRLMAGEGAEFVVRVGKAVAFSSDTNGIPDLTGGQDLASGTAIPLNHLLWFPREGRGIQPAATESNTIFVMVRGPYSHWDKDGSLVKH